MIIWSYWLLVRFHDIPFVLCTSIIYQVKTATLHDSLPVPQIFKCLLQALKDLRCRWRIMHHWACDAMCVSSCVSACITKLRRVLDSELPHPLGTISGAFLPNYCSFVYHKWWIINSAVCNVASFDLTWKGSYHCWTHGKARVVIIPTMLWHQKLSLWQLTVPPVTAKLASWWPTFSSECHFFHLIGLMQEKT